jgi:hypothetical protein
LAQAWQARARDWMFHSFINQFPLLPTRPQLQLFTAAPGS